MLINQWCQCGKSHVSQESDLVNIFINDLDNADFMLTESVDSAKLEKIVNMLEDKYGSNMRGHNTGQT